VVAESILVPRPAATPRPSHTYPSRLIRFYSIIKDLVQLLLGPGAAAIGKTRADSYKLSRIKGESQKPADKNADVGYAGIT
jgi:hypothetical protein